MSGDASTGTDTSTDTGKAGTDDGAKDETKGTTEETGKTGEGKGKDDGKGEDPNAGLKKALAAEHKLREGLEKEKREAELSKLPELEKAKVQVDELTKENERLGKENLRMKIALDMGLTWKLAKRLSGDTEDEMREDAADLLKDYTPAQKKLEEEKQDPKNKRPANDAKKQGGSGGPSMNDLLRAAAGRTAH